jgi:D-beta-D-heptose 7-phosphate kinase/D-beta-D-heptose 1-phosphate adenosyltransferase
MYIVVRGRRPVHLPTRAREVFDVSGAGDTVIAAAMLALVSGADPIEAAALANHAAGVVVGKLGTAACSPAELLDAMERA